MAIWWQASRFHFVPPSYLPAILGSVIAWATTGKFHAGYFLMTVIAVTVNHIALNMTDDYYDYLHSVDQAKEREKNPYSGGSGTLTTGLITPRNMYTAFVLGYGFTIMLGLLLTILRGWQVFLFGIFGIFCAYYYTAPPIRYGYRGLGELSQLINFSITIGLGAYFVQAQQLSWEAFWILLPLGFMMFSMITINEIPDEANDRRGGKQNLVVRFGIDKGVFLYGLGMSIAYLIILIAPVVGIVTRWVWLSLVTLPWFIKAYTILARNRHDPARMSPANMMTIRIHNITGILLISAYLIHGMRENGTLSPMFILLCSLAILYLPVMLTIFFNLLSLKPGERFTNQ